MSRTRLDGDIERVARAVRAERLRVLALLDCVLNQARSDQMSIDEMPEWVSDQFGALLQDPAS